MTEIKKYYDGFSKKLVYDYLLGNPRIENSIKTAINLIDLSKMRILDVGCGIGWSSFEFSKYAREVQGVDLSDNLIKIANNLFQTDNLRFRQLDVTDSALHFPNSFDIVTMLDVFEHIPSSERVMFAKSLNDVLEPSGLVYLSCPSVYHQQWLKKENPIGLQPIDENIDINILWQFASLLDKGDVVYFSYRTIWKNNDYFHAIVQKGPISFKIADNRAVLESYNSRHRRIKRSNSKQKLFNDEEMKDIAKRKRKIQTNSLRTGIKKMFNIN